MKSLGYLSSFHSIRPEYSVSQPDSMVILSKLRDRYLSSSPDYHSAHTEKLIRRIGAGTANIKTRGTEIRDFTLAAVLDPSVSLNAFFKSDRTPDLYERMMFYQQKASATFNHYYSPHLTAKQLPSHVLHVSCTGYVAPSAAQLKCAEWSRTLNTSPVVTHAYHMGCYASLPALRISAGLAASGANNRVDIIHNELCTLHFDPYTIEAEQIVVQSLFADGHIKYTLEQNKSSTMTGFEILALQEEIIPNSEELMKWTPGPKDFRMTLSREVPNQFIPVIKDFMIRMLEKAGIPESTPAHTNGHFDENIIFAIHPGGPKIIESVETALELKPLQTTESHEVLANYGNMSSATLPHIWEKILQNSDRKNGALIVSVAFGPGLTMSGAVFKLCKP